MSTHQALGRTEDELLWFTRRQSLKVLGFTIDAHRFGCPEVPDIKARELVCFFFRRQGGGGDDHAADHHACREGGCGEQLQDGFHRDLHFRQVTEE